MSSDSLLIYAWYMRAIYPLFIKVLQLKYFLWLM